MKISLFRAADYRTALVSINKLESNLIKEDTIHENDISAQEKAALQGSRIQIQNEHTRWKKGSRSQKS